MRWWIRLEEKASVHKRVYTSGWCRTAPCTWPLLHRSWSSRTTETRPTTAHWPPWDHVPHISHTDPADTTAEKKKKERRKWKRRREWDTQKWLSYQNLSVGSGAWFAEFPGLDTCPSPHLDTQTVSIAAAKRHTRTDILSTTLEPTQAKPCTHTHHHLLCLNISFRYVKECSCSVSSWENWKNTSAGTNKYEQQQWILSGVFIGISHRLWTD